MKTDGKPDLAQAGLPTPDLQSSLHLREAKTQIIEDAFGVRLYKKEDAELHSVNPTQRKCLDSTSKQWWTIVPIKLKQNG